MVKTSKGVILSQASQIKSDYSFVLIKATADNKSLVQDASSAELKVNALVEYSKDSQWDPKKLTSLGFPAGCFLIVDLRGQDIHAADLITNLALVRQYGYQAGVIDDLSTLDDIKALKANQIYLINSGKTNDDQDASLNGNEITDGSGKLAVGMSVKWQRDYTNVDVSGDHAGFVGMGQDTLLKGGNAFGYSTNGRDFNAVITPKGLIFRRPDAERMWRLLKPNEIADINSTVGDKVKKEVDSATAEIPAAVSAANSAVSAAESAIAASKVNSDAIVAQSSAVVEAKSAMDSATAEIQQLKANAASDVAQIRADVAQVQNEVDTAKAANSASVDKLKSDIGLVQKDLDNVHDSLTKAQSAVEQNQKLINDSVAKINSDIAQSRQDIITAQQANDDLAKQLNTYSKEAQEQGKTIKTIQDNQDGFSITIADVKGDVTKVSDTVDGLSAGLKDAQGNIASVKAQADQLNATLTDHSKDIAQLTATAKELSSTLEDADGRLSKVEQTASEQSTTLSDLQGNLTQVKQTADNLVTTLKDAQGNIDQIKQDAKGTLEQLSNAQGDITALQKDVSGIKLTIADHDKNIHTLQADSKTLKDDMADAKGNISSLQKTSASLVSEFRDHDGRLSKVEQTATEHTSELADTKGNLDKVTQKADSLEATLTDAQKDINSIKVDASGIHEALTGQGNQIANINVTLNGLNSKYEGVSGDLSNLSNKAMQNRGTVNSPDFNSLTQAGYYTVTWPINGKNYPTGSWGTLEVSGQTSDSNGRLNQKYVSDNNAETYIRQYNANTKSWTAWIKTANQNDVIALSNRITTNSTQITQNQQAIALKADQSTVNNLSGEVSQNKAQLKVQAGQISSKVSSTDFKTLDNKVNGMKIGGRNLVAGTGQDTAIDDTANTGTQGWCFEMFNLTQQPKVGDQLTVSAEGTLTGKGNLSTYEAVLYNMSTTTPRSNVVDLVPGKRSSEILTVSNLYGKGDTVLLIYSGKITDTEGKKLVLHHLKLEFGNVATDWTPAPEDLTTAIQKNTTAINQTNKQISLKADQTEVDTVKNTVSQNGSRLDIMDKTIQSKVTSTDVDNIVDKKGYATTSTVQSLITQKAGTINESITNLTNEVNTRNGVNLLKGTKDFSGSWHNFGSTNYWHTENRIDPNGNHSVKSDSLSWYGYYQPIYLDTGDYTFSGYYYSEGGKPVFCYLRPNSGDNLVEVSYNSNLDSTPNGWRWFVVHFKVTKAGNAAVRLESGQDQVLHIASYKLERGTVTKPVWTPAPSDNATVTQVQQITASIDGLQSRVTNYQNDTSSKYTQLSSLMQSKVGTADFEQLKRSVDMQTLDSADINNMKTNGHYFVHNLTNSPIAGWVYVDVTGNGNNRIRQDVYQDNGIQHKYRRWVDTHWTGWEEGATYTEITQLQDAVNLRVQKGELLSQINLTAGNTLIQSNKLYLDASSVVFSGRAFIPSAAIVSLDADKINTGTLNTQMVSIGDDQTRLWARSNYLYLTGKDQGDAYNMRIGGDKIEFVTTEIPNNAPYMDGITPMYQIAYDGDTKSRLKIRSFNRLTGSNEFPIEMYDSVNISKDEIDLAANNQMKLSIRDDGVLVRRSLFFENVGGTGAFGGFTRADNSNIVEFSTGDNNGENFRIDCGARFMQYVYINGNARAQQWLTNSALSKKMNIRKLDLQTALNKIRQDDQYLYEYKRNVAQGIHDPQASFIIDDVHDVAHYSVPREFIDNTGKYREPSVELAYLIAAFQAIDKQVQAQQAEIKILKEQLQHE